MSVNIFELLCSLCHQQIHLQKKRDKNRERSVESEELALTPPPFNPGLVYRFCSVGDD